MEALHQPNLLDMMELTSVNGRDASVDPIVEAANDAFTRIESHRKLFRRDWLPFLDGVYQLSFQAWELAGPGRTRLDGSPDWTDDRVQTEFRGLVAALPWASYFQGCRRTLLYVLRQIGGDRENFLKWYDDLPEEVRERTGYPETLWKMFEKKKPDPDTDHNNEQSAANANTNTTNDSTNDSTHEQVNAGAAAAQATAQAEIRTDADRMAELVVKNERWHDFGLELRTSLGSGESTLKAGLREKLDRLLEGAA